MNNTNELIISPEEFCEDESILQPTPIEFEEVSIDEVEEAREINNPFPVECLPSSTQTIVRAVSEVMNVPIALPACCALGVISASIGKGLELRSFDIATRANLYILASAESGSGKSKTFRVILAPLFQYEEKLVRTWHEKDLPRLKAEKDIAEEKIKNLKREINSEEAENNLIDQHSKLSDLEMSLKSPALIVEDITSEKLARKLAENNECLASFSADAGAMINVILGKYNSTRRTDENIYLKAFSGDPVRVDRARGDHITLQSPCLTMLLLTQPDKLDTLLKKSELSDGGFIPRLLVCHTNAEPQPIGEEVRQLSEEDKKPFYLLIEELLENVRFSESPSCLSIAPAAKEAIRIHHNQVVGRRKKDLKDIGIFAARWNEQVWRVAIVLHAAEWGKYADKNEVTLKTTQNAIQIVEWFTRQQLDILGESRSKARVELKKRVIDFLTTKPEGVSVRLIQRNRIVRNAAEGHELINEMVKEGNVIAVEAHSKKGKPSIVYKLLLRKI